MVINIHFIYWLHTLMGFRACFFTQIRTEDRETQQGQKMGDSEIYQRGDGGGRTERGREGEKWVRDRQRERKSDGSGWQKGREREREVEKVNDGESKRGDRRHMNSNTFSLSLSFLLPFFYPLSLTFSLSLALPLVSHTHWSIYPCLWGTLIYPRWLTAQRRHAFYQSVN